jgi:sugar phosphate isomerase/epimerase
LRPSPRESSQPPLPGDRMRQPGGFDLTYCTNIHPGNGWDQVLANLKRYAPDLKARLSPGEPFGIGLRLSAVEARELRQDGRLERFRAFLDNAGLYVAILNGYPYGAFHGEPVKERVFAPDWTDRSRLDYTLDLVEIAAALAPEGMDGAVSTVPLAYKPSADPASLVPILDHITEAYEAMARLRDSRGKLVHLDIEPEPDGLIETAAETIDFFGRAVDRAGAGVLEFVQICLDACHFAVEYDSIDDAVPAFQRAGIRIGRLQVSSALSLPLPGPLDRMAAFHEPIYLHQVVERRADGSLRRHRDLDCALAAGPAPDAREWRIHFHVPIFAAEFGGLTSTQAQLASALRLARDTGFTSHLEIETYTWSILPEDLRLDIAGSIEREYRWALNELCTRP